MKLDWYTKRLLRLWTPALIGLVVLVVAAVWGGQSLRFFLFTHHWFYFIIAMLLFNPVIQTFWPSKEVQLQRQRSTQRAKHTRKQPAERKRASRQVSTATAETAGERLTRLQREKAAVDEQITRLTTTHSEENR